MGEKFRFFSKKDRKMAEKFGGTDFDNWREYSLPNGLPSFDKGGHKERSLFHQPNHKKHWKKRGKIFWREDYE